MVAISYDPVEILKSFADSRKITFLMLSDEGSRTIHAYNVHNVNGFPLPGTYLIDQEGVIRADFFLDGIEERHKNAQLIEAAKRIGDPSN